MILIEAFAGTLALSAWLLNARSLIGYMGAKRALAPAIASAIGIERGEVEHVVCADAGPWGDFWAHFAAHGLAVADWFGARAKEGAVMPELWKEQVQHPPHGDPALRLAQFLTLQSRTASATPIWWAPTRERWVMPSGHAHNHRIFDATARGRHSVEVVGRGDARKACEKGTGAGRRSGIIDPRTLAHRLRALHAALAHRLTAHHGDTAELLDLLPADLAGYVVYLDPPYVGATPYAAACARATVLELARAYRARGAIVVISEGEPMPLEGWHTVDLASARASARWTARQRGEWLTMSRPPVAVPAVQLSLWAAP